MHNFRVHFVIGIFSICCEIVLVWISLDLTDEKSIYVKKDNGVMPGNKTLPKPTLNHFYDTVLFEYISFVLWNLYHTFKTSIKLALSAVVFRQLFADIKIGRHQHFTVRWAENACKDVCKHSGLLKWGSNTCGPTSAQRRPKAIRYWISLLQNYPMMIRFACYVNLGMISNCSAKR